MTNIVRVILESKKVREREREGERERESGGDGGEKLLN